MNMVRFFGVTAAACTLFASASATEIKITEPTGGAKESKLELNANNRTIGGFPIILAPAYLSGLQMVSVPRGNIGKEGIAYSVTIDKPATVYLLVHNRGNVTVPEDWTKLPGQVVWFAGGTQSDKIYKKEFAAGKVDVPAHNGKDGASFGVPSAIVISPESRDADSNALLSVCDEKSRRRVSDGTFTITAIPGHLKGLPMISVPRGNTSNPGAAYSFILAKPAKLYLLVHDRGTPAVPEGWAKEEGKVNWALGGGKYADTVYTKEFPAGKVDVPAHNGKDGATFGVPNAVVIQYL